jgi:hypothetical protein
VVVAPTAGTGGPEGTFIAFYLTDLCDPVIDEHDAAFRSLLAIRERNAGASDLDIPRPDRS